MNTTFSTTPEELTLSHAIPDFEYSGENLDTWNAGKTGNSHFWNAISCILPNLETYGVSAVSHVVGRVSDKKLSAEARVFCKQEATHAKSHDQLNDLLEKQFPFLKTINKVERQYLRFLSYILSVKMFLAVFVFVEHLTAILGHKGLEEPDNWFKETDPVLFQLWQWHAIEEVAHKSVCFDLHRAIGGGYISRILGFVIGSSVLLPGLSLRILYLGLSTKNKFQFFKQFIRHMLGSKGVFPVLFKDFLGYFHVNYQPWSMDSRDLIERFKAEYEEITHSSTTHTFN